MKLTVIIPVYRVEATLNRCVESVVRQHVPEMEIILVDDGSPDKCPQICDEWAQKDTRIHVIHKSNGGLSDARNAALDIAKGEVITFVDSDDYLADNTYPALLDMIDGTDILEFSIADKLTLTDCFYDDINTYWFESQAYTHTYAWNKLFHRELFDGIRFPNGKVFEDAFTTPKLLKAAHSIRTTRQGSYHYCDNPQGITAKADGHQLAMLLEAHLGNHMPINDDYYMHLLNIQIDVWEQAGLPVTLPSRKVDIRLFQGYNKLKAIILNALGINIICKISKLIHHIKKPRRL